MQQVALEGQLEKQGARVTVAGTVKEGFRALRQKSFALMLIDMELPDGLGVTLIECARRFPESKNHTAVIIGLIDRIFVTRIAASVADRQGSIWPVKNGY